MIKNLSVTNFRGYQHVKLSNLKRVNVIVGGNASGKTALLEALYLALGAHPELYFKLRGQRGLGDRVPLPFNREAASDLFYSASDPAIVSYVGTPGLTRSVKIFYDANAPTTIPLQLQIQDAATSPPLAFQWKQGNRTMTLHAVFTKDGIQVVGGPPEPVSASFFSSAMIVNPIETANRFHALSVLDNEGDVVDAMRGIFPVISKLSVGSYASAPMVYANLEGVKGKKPLGLVSAGINKLLAIVVAIFEAAGRVVLIDEIENGLYYEILPKAWARLYEFSQKNRTQLFVSTHSLEALRSLLPTMKGIESQFCLLQTKFVEGKCEVRYVQGLDFEAALEEGVEVR